VIDAPSRLPAITRLATSAKIASRKTSPRLILQLWHVYFRSPAMDLPY
jgi:hypothetical protein